MEESMQNFDEVYADFGKDALNEDISGTTVSEEEFQQEWHRIVDEVYTGQYGNSKIWQKSFKTIKIPHSVYHFTTY